MTIAPALHFLCLRSKRVTSLCFLAAAMLLAPLVWAEGSPHITGVDPPSGKVNDSITLSGDNLGKDSVTSIFLSDDKEDYKATIVSQADDKIVIKVPKVKPGAYNISIGDAKTIMILPIRFTVEQ